MAEVLASSATDWVLDQSRRWDWMSMPVSSEELVEREAGDT